MGDVVARAPRPGPGGARPGAGRPLRNPDRLPELERKSKYWLITIFYDDDNHDKRVAKFLSLYRDDMATFVVYGRELSSDGRRHLQCYVELVGGKKGRTVKCQLGVDDAHFEVVTAVLPCGKKTTYAHSRWNCFCYCTKGSEPKTQEGPNDSWDGEELGDRPPRPAHKRVASEAIDICRKGDWNSIGGEIRMRHSSSPLSDRSIYMSQRHLDVVPVLRNLWIVGPTRIGKSYFVRNSFPPDKVYRKSLDRLWHGYEDQPIVWIDGLSPKKIPTPELRIWADHYPFRVHRERDSWMIRPQHVIVTSKYRIDQICMEAPSLDGFVARFQVIDLYERCDGSGSCACLRCAPTIEARRAAVAERLAAAIVDWPVVQPEPTVSSQASVDETAVQRWESSSQSSTACN